MANSHISIVARERVAIVPSLTGAVKRGAAARGARRSATVPINIERPIILLVDDDPAALNILDRLLYFLARRYEIVAVGSGVAALAVTATRPVALVITDFYMPGMYGAQLTDAIKAASPTTRVAIITAYAVPDVARQAHAVAADYVLPKPLKLAQLKQMLEESLPITESDE
jgi:two-component system response regulator (stage 0 sporulation protein F)